ncbi:sure-like protein [Cristinia sonorae]|uniref:Sure-like protein n=1 Tax=Cristinia sonorae TaxID=1940300 RepID=A0A8K0US55_9AGAR|nr:sure-like protein [Cristinia sonorae]
MSSKAPLRVLLTNDDGPPGRDSPYIYGLYRHLKDDLGWDVKVVIPSSQKSWIGKAYQITETVKGRYFYPRQPDGVQGDLSEFPRPLKDGEHAEWVLLDGTPATCANIALHNLYPGQIDLLISGPNLGRNTSAAFSLSSGTIGAALSSSLSKIRSIAVSYGTVVHPTPAVYFEPAHLLSSHIIRYLWDNWGLDEGGIRNGEVDLYNVNVPMVEGLLTEKGLDIYWTKIWRNSYGRLFKAQETKPTTSPAGPDSLNAPSAGFKESNGDHQVDDSMKLVFRFAPDIAPLINPAKSSLPLGTDGWAISNGWASVTPLRASFAEPPSVQEQEETVQQADKRLWKMKL